MEHPFDRSHLDWKLYSSTVTGEPRFSVPWEFREIVSLDSENPTAFWGYDLETGYAYLSEDYANTDRYITVKNQSYDLEDGSRILIPKHDDERITEGVLGADRPNKGEVVFLYTDSRLLEEAPKTVIVMSSRQFEVILREHDMLPMYTPPSEDGAVGVEVTFEDLHNHNVGVYDTEKLSLKTSDSVVEEKLKEGINIPWN